VPFAFVEVMGRAPWGCSGAVVRVVRVC
jgi:hypothetical protein